MVNCRPQLLNEAISSRLAEPPSDIDWPSPLATDHYAEYRDQEFIDRLESSQYLKELLRIVRPLTDFWPRLGPQWDADSPSQTRGKFCCSKRKPIFPR